MRGTLAGGPGEETIAFSVTPVMAVRLGKFCGNRPWLWLRMQQEYDLWRVEKRLQKEIDEIPALMRC